MDDNALNEPIVIAIKDSAVPRIDKQKLVERYGAGLGETLASEIATIIQEAVKMPIEWGGMTLEEGMNDIMKRFARFHPELSKEALHEIGRCVAWNWR
ncbi:MULTISPECIES: hypothetical protein [unclassified Mycobacterium]|uniref:hypothetical protein n=1 Tax=unclassified Mycobacterium TaxID=2642494 RepID=UPI0009EE3839|nr:MULTISPECIES: hypothetical protein [unclassified Mycobacterium]